MLRNRNRELVRIYFKVVKNIKRDPNNTRDLNNQLKDSQQYFRNINQLVSDNLKQKHHVHPTNYNLEEYQKYTRNVLAQAQVYEKEEEEGNRKGGRKLKKQNRKFDSPRIDLNMENYYVWQTYYRENIKTSDQGIPITAKLKVQPKWFIKAFGGGKAIVTRTKSSTREWDFEDSNGDSFLVYDHRQTQDYHGNKPVGVDYNDYRHRAFRPQRKLYPSFEEFWSSEEYYELRAYGSRYADSNRFKLYIEQEIQKAKEQGYDYEQEVINKYGSVDSKSSYDVKYQLECEVPAVYLYDFKWWENKDKKVQKQSVEGFNDCMKILELKKLVKPERVKDEEYRIEPFSLQDYELQLQQEEKERVQKMYEEMTRQLDLQEETAKISDQIQNKNDVNSKDDGNDKNSSDN